MEYEYPSGATPLEIEEQEGLLLSHITTHGELNRWEQENITDAILWYDIHPPGSVLSISFTRELHKRMFGNVWRWAGDFRKSQKNIGVPWAQIPIELRKLFDTIQFWIEKSVFKQKEIAVRFHHLLVSIHAFANGNGRHARLYTDLLLQNCFKKKPFIWGDVDLAFAGEIRTKYLQALYLADKGDYSQLMAFVEE